MAKELTRELLWESGVQFGHQTKRWNPKMKPYIYGEKNKIHIIDLQQTISSFEAIKKLMTKIVSKNGKVLFVGTKKQAKWIVKDAAERCGCFYVNQRWLGGTLTNLKTIHLRVMHLWNIERQEKSGELKLLTKKEQLLIKKEKEKLEKFLGGIKAMKELPAAVFVVDPKEEYIAVREAKKLRIPVISICDTNVDPDEVDYIIPGNDDTARSIALLTHHVAEIYGEIAGIEMPEQQFKPNENFRRGEGEEGQNYHNRGFIREFSIDRVRVIENDVRKTLENLKTFSIEKIAKLANIPVGERYEMFEKLVSALEIQNNRLAIKEQVNKVVEPKENNQ